MMPILRSAISAHGRQPRSFPPSPGPCRQAANGAKGRPERWRCACVLTAARNRYVRLCLHRWLAELNPGTLPQLPLRTTMTLKVKNLRRPEAEHSRPGLDHFATVLAPQLSHPAQHGAQDEGGHKEQGDFDGVERAHEKAKRRSLRGGGDRGAWHDVAMRQRPAHCSSRNGTHLRSSPGPARCDAHWADQRARHLHQHSKDASQACHTRRCLMKEECCCRSPPGPVPAGSSAE